MKVREYLNEAGPLDNLRKIVKADDVTQSPWDVDTDPYYGKHKFRQITLKFNTSMNRKKFDELKVILYKEAKNNFPDMSDISISGAYGGKTTSIHVTLIKQMK